MSGRRLLGMGKGEFRALWWVIGAVVVIVAPVAVVTRVVMESPAVTSTSKLLIGLGTVVVSLAAHGVCVWRASVAAGKDFES